MRAIRLSQHRGHAVVEHRILEKGDLQPGRLLQDQIFDVVTDPLAQLPPEVIQTSLADESSCSHKSQCDDGGEDGLPVSFRHSLR